MGRETFATDTRLNPRLEADITQVGFYRLCQILEKQHAGHPPSGSTSNPADDPVRFYPYPGMGFPAGEVKAVEYDDSDRHAPPVIRTTFLGLYGVDSPLPTTWIDDIVTRREGHEAMQGFLDIFSHRIMTQFYRIWRKYSYPATFEAGGSDAISQSLLGLVGLGIPGTASHIATPVSRFLALLSVLRLPGRTEAGIRAIVHLLAPATTVQVLPYSPRTVPVREPPELTDEGSILLDGSLPLGDELTELNSQIRIALSTADEEEAQSWFPGGELYHDFLVMLRVYLGWRCKARITLTLSTALLAVRPLGDTGFSLGMSGVLSVDGPVTTDDIPDDIPPDFTLELCHYHGLTPAVSTKGNTRVIYQFD